MDPLKTYKRILEGKEKPKFIKAKEDGTLEKKIKEAEGILENCKLCERQCGVNRFKEKGFCGVGNEWRIFGAHTHWDEEKELIPSATIFESGCTMKCVYCQNAPESMDYNLGEEWSVKSVAEWIERKWKEGCKNINFVGGDPTPYIPHILKALSLVNVNMPVVFNSNAYLSETGMKLLDGVVDVYLFDFRYFSEKCARKLSSAPDYPEVAKRNHLLAKQQGELMIRVLVMPGHIECDAKPVLRWIAENLGNVYVNVLGQYHPCWKAWDFPELKRNLSSEEYWEVISYGKGLGLKV
ncbi:MAG: radical SAM protein [Candidatus Aenigmatarchaeota archaeon]|nr:MAG: radical SAM protein [Candidatus Aenigmarchaeota archaeon]